MVTLSIVDGVHDFGGNGLVVPGTTTLAFQGSISATANFLDEQFDLTIASNVLITNLGAGTAELIVTLAAQPAFSAAGWTFGIWTVADKITIYGSSLNDMITGSIKADTILGGAGNDTINSNGGADMLDGGGGTADLLILNYGTAITPVNASVASFAQGFQFLDGAFVSGFERLNLTSGSGHDSVVGGALSDTLVGGDGNDTLDGSLGADRLLGGIGDDVVISGVGNSLEVQIDGGAGLDVLVINRATTLAALSISASVFQDSGGSWSFLGFERFNVTTGAGNDSLVGAAFADTLIGGAGTDTLVGGAGAADIIDGGEGLDDLVFIDRRSATASITLSVPTLATGYVFDNGTSVIGCERINLVTGQGHDNLVGGGLADTIDAGAGDDTLTGGGGADAIFAGLGSDIVTSMDADTVLDGGGDIDTLVLSRRAVTSNIFFDAAILSPIILPDQTQISGFEVFAFETGSGADTLIGGKYNDWLFAFAGRDALYGGDGNDTLGGGDGGDTLDGGSGNDRLLGDQGFDVLDGGLGADTLDGADGNDLLDAGLGNDWLSGGDGFDVLDGGDGADLLSGAGNDTLLGGQGDDFIYCGAANDVTEGGGGSDIMLGDDGNDQLDGGEGNDFIFGGIGLNNLAGGMGNDVLYSGGVADTMDGGGGEHDVFYRFAIGTSFTTGSGAIDEFIGGNWLSNDTVYAGAGDDYLFGGDGDDLLVGDAGNDVILGQNGNDTLDGGAGVNAIWADGAGSDQLRVNIADGGIQVLQGFEVGGINDVVRLLGSTLTSFSQIETLRATLGLVVDGNAIYNSGVGCQLYLNMGPTQTAIWFQGVSAYSLTSGDFLFG
jgi:Ca2+-binding RTX toxin-like protein